MSRTVVSKRSRINNWDDQKDEILMGILKEQQLLGHGTAGQFPYETWPTIVEAFNQKTALSYRLEHLKNRLKVLRKAYILYNDIVKKAGWKWDPVRNIPTAVSPSKWNEIITVNPEYAKCRDKPFPRYKDLDFLCGKKTEGDSSGDDSLAEPDDLNVTGRDRTAEDDDLGVTGKVSMGEANGLGATGRSPCNMNYPTTSRSAELPKHHNKAHSPQSKPQFTPNLFHDPSPQNSEAFSEEESLPCSPERHLTFALPLSYCHQKRRRDKSDDLAKLVDVERQRLEIARERLNRAIALRPKVYSIEDCIKKLEKL